MTISVDHVYGFSKIDRNFYWISQHGMALLNILVGFYVLIPILAPVFMSMGWTIPGKAIYWIYSFLCHQLPQRSYFLFGSGVSYTIPEIQAVWPNANNIVTLRQFAGNPDFGWKVAWSDRMVSMFTSLWIFGILWGIFKNKIKNLPWWGLVLLLLPMGVDGLTHFFSDFAGLGQGFRDSNAWLATLTNNTFPAAFYTGDALGSFNAWMRLITGLLFGLGIVWFGFPFLNEAFRDSAEVIEYKHQRRILFQKEKDRLTNLSSAGILRSEASQVVVQVLQEGENDKTQ